jgi:Leucine-rich repeat (LRR) protein/GTPase SAR1 family protein
MSGIEEARRRIRKCLANQETELDLSDCDLKSLNEINGIYECQQLKKIVIERNFLTNFNNLRSLTNLTEIHASHNLIDNTKELKYLSKLNILDLSKNQIKSIDELALINTLSELKLYGTAIRNVSQLTNLKNLKSLDVSYNEFLEYSSLKNLNQIKSLTLGGENYGKGDISEIRGLLNLEELIISKSLVEVIDDIAELTNLKHLDLSKNYILKIEKLQKLKQLEHLNLSDNNNINIIPIFEFTNLRYLSIYGIGLKTLEPISKLANLTYLDASSNIISNLKPLKELFQLETLHLFSNRIQNLEGLNYLTKLKTLNLCSNEISDILPICQLSEISNLNLSANKLLNISNLAKLSKINCLEIDHNFIEDLDIIKSLTNLTILNLLQNQVVDLSPLSESKSLISLNLAHNRIKKISALSKLENLEQLYLKDNEIEDFSPLLENLAYKEGRIKFINVKQNLSSIDIPYIVEKGYESLKAYYDSQETEGTIPNDQLKVILLGNSTAGKTSLLNYLGKKEFNENQTTTHGLSRLMDFEFKEIETNELKTKHVNFWDFGGQDYYHATHRLFITRGSLGIIVCHQDLEDRKEEEDYFEKIEITENDVKKTIEVPVKIKHYPYSYWLKTFAHLTKAKNESSTQPSKVFLVENKCAARKSTDDMELSKDFRESLPMEIINKKFFHLDIREAFRFKEKIEITDLTEEYHDEFKRFERRLKSEIEKSFNDNSFEVHANYPVIRDVLVRLAKEIRDGEWENNLRDLLEELEIPTNFTYEKLPVWITYDEYIGIIESKSKVVNEHTIGFITTYLRDFCGTILYFEEIPNLKNIVFIDPQWLHTRIYLFLNKDFVKGRKIIWKGESLDLKQGEFILDEVDEKFEGDYLDASQLLDLMKAFELVFEIPNQIPRRFIAPQYLPTKPPVSDAQLNKLKHSYHEIALTLEFGQYLPPSLISRIISQKGHLIKENDEPLWRNGLIYEENGQSTFVLCIPEENKIEIHLNSKDELIKKRVLRDFMVFMEEKYADELEEMYLKLPNERKVKWRDLYAGKKQRLSKIISYDRSDLEGISLKPYEFLIEDVEQKPINIFICYAHDDFHEMVKFVEPLKKELASIANQHNIKFNPFTDQQLTPGMRWNDVLKAKIKENDILICLLSSSFFTSGYIQQNEYGQVMREIAKGERDSLIAPIYLKSCYVSEANPIANLQFYKPLSTDFGMESISNFSFNNLLGHDNRLIDNYVLKFVESIKINILEIWKTK